MNWNVIEGNWEQFKGQLRQKWGKLTDQDLELLKGKGQEMYGVLQEKVGLKKDEFKREFDTLSDSFIQKVKDKDPKNLTH